MIDIDGNDANIDSDDEDIFQDPVDIEQIMDNIDNETSDFQITTKKPRGTAKIRM